jgi:hypothetical protein
LRAVTAAPRKQIYRITCPNGKIYVGMDLTGTPLYVGSPNGPGNGLPPTSTRTGSAYRMRKKILWESKTATDVRSGRWKYG